MFYNHTEIHEIKLFHKNIDILTKTANIFSLNCQIPVFLHIGTIWDINGELWISSGVLVSLPDGGGGAVGQNGTLPDPWCLASVNANFNDIIWNIDTYYTCAVMPNRSNRIIVSYHFWNFLSSAEMFWTSRFFQDHLSH